MLVVAHRFGMNWIGEFNPSDGKMNASGCGHTLSSETIRGLGLVLRYAFREESRRAQNPDTSRRSMRPGEFFAPTETADKLHCGIVPIDAAAVIAAESQRDIHLIGGSRKVDLRGLLVRLGITSPESDVLRDSKHVNEYGAPGRHFKHGIEEAISVLCPIAPLPGSKSRWIMWPIWNIRRPITPMRQLHGLRKLTQHLSTYMTRSQRAVTVMAERTSYLEHLQKSPLSYLEQLCCASKTLQDPRYISDTDKLLEIRNIYERIQNIHKETSKVIASVQSPDDADVDDTRPFLMDLAAAHITMATKYGKAADDTARKETQDDDTLPKPKGISLHLRYVEELAKFYVEDLDTNQQGTVVRHLRRKGYDHLGLPEIKALWWTMVIRSACWWISVRIQLPETQIPSHWYNSQTPVYIT